MVPIGLQLFKWSEYYILNPSYNLTSDDLWPWYMTFDHTNIQRVPYCINKVTDLNFSNEATFTFSAYLTTWPQMALDLDMWPLTSSTNEGSMLHQWPNFGWNPLKHVEGRAKCSPIFTTENKTTTGYKAIPVRLSC